MKTKLRTCLEIACGILLLSSLTNTLPVGPDSFNEENSTFQNSTVTPECLVDDVVYKGGDVVPSPGPCEECHCEPPSVMCSMIKCKPNTSGCRVLQMPKHCCPHYKCDCEFKGKTYNNGERLERPDDPCHVCYCKGGEIMCTSITCYQRDDCAPRYIPGRCCPKYDHCPVEPSHNSGNSVRSVNNSSYLSNREMQPWLLTKAVKMQPTTPPSQENTPGVITYPLTIRIREVIPTTTESPQKGSEVRLEIPVRPNEVHAVVIEPHRPPLTTTDQVSSETSSEDNLTLELTTDLTLEDVSLTSESEGSGSSESTNSKYIVHVKPLSPLAEGRKNSSSTNSLEKSTEGSEKKPSAETTTPMETNSTVETTLPSSEHVFIHHPGAYLFESESNEEIGTESSLPSTTGDYEGTSVELIGGGVYDMTSTENETSTEDTVSNEVASVTSSQVQIETKTLPSNQEQISEALMRDNITQYNSNESYVTEKEWTSVESIELNSSEENSSDNASIDQDLKEFIPLGLDLGDQIQYLKLGGHHPVQNSFEDQKTTGNEKDSYYTKEPDHSRFGSPTPVSYSQQFSSPPEETLENETVPFERSTETSPDVGSTTEPEITSSIVPPTASKEQWASQVIDKIVSNIMLPMQGIEFVDANITNTTSDSSTLDISPDEFFLGDKTSYSKESNDLLPPLSTSDITTLPELKEIELGTSFPAEAIATVTDFLEVSPTVGSFLPMKEEIESTVSQQEVDSSDDLDQRTNIETQSSPRKVTVPSLESLLQQLPSTLDDRDLFVLREFLKKHMNIS